MNKNKKRYALSLFIFRRDLRLEDNTSLMAALHDSEQVIPCFILDPRQCDKNDYKSLPSIQFMVESLQDLQEQLRKKGGQLFLFHGIAEKIVKEILKNKRIDAVYFNRDYTPFSQKRDQAIVEVCDKLSIPSHVFDDVILNPPQCTLKADGTCYQIFSRFYQQARLHPVGMPRKNNFSNYYNGKIQGTEKDSFLKKWITQKTSQIAQHGGRQECLKILSNLKEIKNYAVEHDYPAKNATTGLSAHLKFTTCSVREIYHAISSRVPAPASLIRELYWRDFFTVIAFYYPHVFGHAYQKKYDSLSWDNNKTLFTAWCQGKTGFPLVDAGMRQLNETGYMHNRVRLVTASFLVKDLHIDWRWGERYFAQKLVDYDPAINNGNWQWVAGTGTDAQPYFRIFNPWLQQRKFDPDCLYIKRWIPELAHMDKNTIHTWYKEHYNLNIPHYPAPLVNHAAEAIKAKKIYAKVQSNFKAF